MIRKLPIYLLVALMLATVAACNKDKEVDAAMQEISNSSVTVKSFSLARNDSVLARLDSVFFSIDLNNALIFNADSLPKGTKINKLVLKIGLPDLHEATIIQPKADGSTREINYLEVTNDSVDFTHGDVTLRLVSNDKKVTRNYTIRVNVHKMIPDSLYWNQTAVTALPGTISAPTAQKTVEFDSKAYCYVTDGTATELSVSDNPGSGGWDSRSVTLPAGALVSTITAGTSEMFILTASGDLYSSADGASWTATGASGLHHIYGEYDGKMILSRHDSDGWKIVEYPSMSATDMPEGFPVEGTSVMLSYVTKWADNPTAIMLGGLDAGGGAVAATWAFDGTTWSEISMNPLPEGLAGVTLVPYFSYRTNSKNWVITKLSTLVAMGGVNTAGAINTTVYLSFDNGIRWQKANYLMQLPDYIPAFRCADALVFSSMLTRHASDCWTAMPSRQLPPWLMTATGTRSRAVNPITEWECPFIYLFGGYDADGNLHNSIWRGVINRLTFKPLQ